MNVKRTLKYTCLILVFCILFSPLGANAIEQPYTYGYVTVFDQNSGQEHDYEAIVHNGELYLSADDISRIIKYPLELTDDSLYYQNYSNSSSITIQFNGDVYVRGESYQINIHNINGNYYLPLEKLLYLANAQWCVENQMVCVQLTPATIIEFYNTYSTKIVENGTTQIDLLMNGESVLSNAAKETLAAVFNDFDVRLFIPIYGVIAWTEDEYQEAMLQLTSDDTQFLGADGQAEIDDLIDGSPFTGIKSIWDNEKSVIDFPKNILTATDYVNQTYLWIKDAKNGTKMFSEYNNLANFSPARLNALSKEMGGISDAFTIINGIVKVNEIATRSKEWNEDFLSQLKVLTNFDQESYDENFAKDIQNAAQKLIDEKQDIFSASADAAVEETFKILGSKLVDLTPAGTFTNVITTALSLAKVLNNDFADAVDARDLSSMVRCLIRVEWIARTEMIEAGGKVGKSFVQGQLSIDQLERLRDTMMLTLRAGLRNKAFIYYLNTKLNDDVSWTSSAEATNICSQIQWYYARLLELCNTESLDQLLILDEFDKMYCNDTYGRKRQQIDSNNVLHSEQRAPLNTETITAPDYSIESDPQRTTSGERDIVLVLDTSGSMSGTPIEETRKASVNFIDTILQEDASIGVVTYEDSANMLSDFSMDRNALESVVNGIDSGGSTNIEAGLQMARDMLEYSNAEKKIIVLMSDGVPNMGKQGEDLISYADEIKAEGTYIYTLGFFESLGNKASAQALMEGIASEGCHYEVDSADNLVFFFGDIADQINGTKYIYIRIACPVDVTVSYNGETLDSDEENLSTRTSFGSLTFEEYEDEANEDDAEDRIKVLRLKEGTDYDIEINGTGRGKMDYTIGFMDETGEYSDLRKFRNIAITSRTKIDTVATVSNSTVLNVDEDGDGKYDLKYKAGENEFGELVDYTYVIYIAAGAVALLIVLIVGVKMRKRFRKKGSKNN